MTEQELLKVLDITKDEQQIKALYELGYTDYFVKLECGRDGVTYECRIGSLADFAFRLRDEAMSSPNFYSAMLDIHQKVEGAAERSQDYVFWAMRATPIHWIIASLIAKGKVSRGKSK